MEKFSSHRLSLVFLIILCINGLLLFVAVPYLQKNAPKLYSIEEFPDHYGDIAWNVATGKGYRVYPDTDETMMREPGYVYFLAGIFLLFGKSITAVKTVNLLLSLFSSLLILKLGQRLKIDRLAVSLAVVFFLCHPAIILLESRGSFECLFITLLLVTTYTFYVARDTDSVKYYALAGVVIGLTTLTRSTILPCVGLFYIYLLIWTKKRQLSFIRMNRNMAVLVLSMSIVVSVWSVRNYRLAGTFVPFGSVLGDALYQGLYVHLHSASGKEHKLLLDEAAREQNDINRKLGLRFRDGFFATYFDVQDEIRHSAEMKNFVLSKYREHPMLILEVPAVNFVRFWFLGGYKSSTYLNIVLMVPILLLSVMGIYLALKSKIDLGPILLITTGIIFVHLVVLAKFRYHTPLIPFLMILCGITVSSLLKKISFISRWWSVGFPDGS